MFLHSGDWNIYTVKPKGSAYLQKGFKLPASHCAKVKGEFMSRSPVGRTETMQHWHPESRWRNKTSSSHKLGGYPRSVSVPVYFRLVLLFIIGTADNLQNVTLRKCMPLISDVANWNLHNLSKTLCWFPFHIWEAVVRKTYLWQWLMASSFPRAAKFIMWTYLSIKSSELIDSWLINHQFRCNDFYHSRDPSPDESDDAQLIAVQLVYFRRTVTLHMPIGLNLTEFVD